MIEYFNEDCMVGMALTVKLGSLFDGIGGFPLSAIQHGIEKDQNRKVRNERKNSRNNQRIIGKGAEQ